MKPSAEVACVLQCLHLGNDSIGLVASDPLGLRFPRTNTQPTLHTHQLHWIPLTERYRVWRPRILIRANMSQELKFSC
jgi:hypothetical protein